MRHVVQPALLPVHPWIVRRNVKNPVWMDATAIKEWCLVERGNRAMILLLYENTELVHIRTEAL